jgi:hypothetical protein
LAQRKTRRRRLVASLERCGDNPAASSPACAQMHSGLSWPVNASSRDMTFLKRDENLALARQPEDEINVERLSEARVPDSRRKPARFGSLGHGKRFCETRAEGEGGDARPLALDASALDRQGPTASEATGARTP